MLRKKGELFLNELKKLSSSDLIKEVRGKRSHIGYRIL